MKRYDFNRKPEIWNDEEGDMAWVDVTAETPDVSSALAYLIEHGHSELDLFDDLLYRNPDGQINPASVHCRGVDLTLVAGSGGWTGGIPELIWPGRLLASGAATGTWRFDISVAELQPTDPLAAR